MKEIIIMQFMLCFQRAFYQCMDKARKNDKVTPGQFEFNLICAYMSFFKVQVIYEGYYKNKWFQIRRFAPDICF